MVGVIASRPHYGEAMGRLKPGGVVIPTEPFEKFLDELWRRRQAPYDFVLFFPDAPGAGSLMATYVIDRLVRLPAGLADSQGWAGTPPVEDVELVLKRNADTIGGVRFAAESNTATFEFASEVVLGAGDRLSIYNQAAADSALADISVTLAGTREQ